MRWHHGGDHSKNSVLSPEEKGEDCRSNGAQLIFFAPDRSISHLNIMLTRTEVSIASSPPCVMISNQLLSEQLKPTLSKKRDSMRMREVGWTRQFTGFGSSGFPNMRITHRSDAVEFNVDRHAICQNLWDPLFALIRGSFHIGESQSPTAGPQWNRDDWDERAKPLWYVFPSLQPIQDQIILPDL
jgi:hypothetical protein